jgi:hypothetical protein
MLVQKRTGSLRLIRQHDHALASGEMAAAWIGNDAAPAPLGAAAILGVALHDIGWMGADRRPRFDAATGSVVGFETFPRADRAVFYSEGLELMERVHPYAGLLGALHYVAFPMPDDFVARESQRKERLMRQFAASPAEAGRILEDYALLVQFDDLSLFVCLTGPLSLAPPAWLDADRVGEGADGVARTLTWRDEHTLAIAPFPFRGELELAIPCRDLPDRFESEATLHESWERTAEGRHRVRLVPR